MMDKWNECVWFVILLVNFLLYSASNNVNGQWGELDEGQKCGNTFINGGICRKVTQCASAMSALAKKRMHNLDRCGFDGRIEVVCCPESEARLPGNYDDYNKTSKPITTWGESDEDATKKPTIDNNGRDNVNVKQNTKRKSERVCEELSKNVPAEVEFQILGGTAANDTEFPHMAALGYLDDDGKLEWRCGGSLISDEYVITAAHCIISASKAVPVKVRLGRINLAENTASSSSSSSNRQAYDYDIANITTHENYVIHTKENDIALLKLTEPPPKTPHIYPACLYNKEDDPSPLTATGWGYTQPGQNPSSILQKGTLNPVPVQRCNRTYIRRTNKQITRKQICAGSDDGKTDTCTGDSGGPLQIKLKRNASIIHSVVGITSFGTGCGGTTPAVYTRIYSYLDWIEKNVWP